MNHLKPFNGIFESSLKQMDDNQDDLTPEQIIMQKQIKSFSKDLKLGTDRLGNDEVFILSRGGISFEVFDMPKNYKGQTEYIISYKKDGDEWEEIITTELITSMRSIIEGSPTEYDGSNYNDGRDDDRDGDGYECEDCVGGYIDGEECYNCGGDGWLY